ncbi:MAG: DEAD/DEAH box helicase [Porphyromonadaceae bacterium]|nr:DEAD/DEAH box helicase [Porphyromonadaceae bacterium]
MKFDELDLEFEVLQGLDAMNFKETTPVQEATIPVVLEGKDVIACAQTGTGKTAAYILPLLNLLTRKPSGKSCVRAVVIAPTRELAQQIDMQFEGFSYFLPISTFVVAGGGDGMQWDQQKRGLQMGADVMIATPGRLISHLLNTKMDLSGVEYLVLDEADRMLDMGFYDDIMQISSFLPKERQTLLFSATMPPKIRQLARQILRNPVEVSIAISKPNESIHQSAYICYEPQKMGIIHALFAQGVKGKTIIFSSSKLKVKQLTTMLRQKKYNARAMHSDLDQPQREEVMLDYKNGKIDILVATDIVARGIDITDIALVINYDVPHDPEDYIHRIGRTARANAEGEAITFVAPDDQMRFSHIEKFLEREIPKLPLPEGLGEAPSYDVSSPLRPTRGAGGPRRTGGRGQSANRTDKSGRRSSHGNRHDKGLSNKGGQGNSAPSVPTPETSTKEEKERTNRSRRNYRHRPHRQGNNPSTPKASGKDE